MNSIPDRPEPIVKVAIEKKYPARNPNVDSGQEVYDSWLVAAMKKVLIALFVVAVGIMLFMLMEARTSYNYRIAVNGNHYQCNVIERGNPTYLKDCWQGNNIIIYDPVNMVVIE